MLCIKKQQKRELIYGIKIEKIVLMKKLNNIFMQFLKKEKIRFNILKKKLLRIFNFLLVQFLSNLCNRSNFYVHLFQS